MTQAELGHRIGKTVTTISRMENGAGWSTKTIFALADAVDADVSEFFRPIEGGDSGDAGGPPATDPHPEPEIKHKN